MADKGTASAVAEGLVAAGVSKIFTLSGNQIMPIFDACLDAGIELVHVRHEAAAVFMAEAWAQLSGDIGVALVAAGPGFANGLAPLYSARCSETPVVLISGDAPISQDGMGAFQELDQVAISAPLTKVSLRSVDAREVGSDLATVIRAARGGRPGPVHWSVPSDVLDETLNGDAFAQPGAFLAPVDRVNGAMIGRIAETLAQAASPLVITGPALSYSRNADLLLRLGRGLVAPVVCMESPRGLSDPSLGGFARVVGESDWVLCLGKAADYSLKFAATFAASCRFLVVDPDPEVLQRQQQILGDRAVMLERADPTTVARELGNSNKNSTGDRQRWLQRVARVIAERVSVPANDSGSGPVHPALVCQAVQRVLTTARDPILICDGGEFGQWAQAFVSAPTRIINGISGAIGGGPCYGLAAKACRPDATVIAMVGDGTVGFHLAEFETALRCKAPFTVVIGHDARWNAEALIQERHYGLDRRIGTDLQRTRYDLAVSGLGGHGEFVAKATQLDEALERAIHSGLPACINVQLDGLPAPLV